MAVTTTPRLGLKTYSAGTDPHPSRTEFNEQQQRLEEMAAIAAQGATAARPTAGIWGRLYWDRDQGRLYWDTGTAWQEVATTGGGGAGAAVAVGGAGSEGTSTRAARADHVHPLPLATTTAAGGMSAADKSKLDGGTSLATASRLVMRDAGGRARFAEPVDAADAATRNYVDTGLPGRAAASHSHAWDSITGKPTAFPPSAHGHAWSEITGTPAAYPPAAHSHSAADLTSGVLDPARLPRATSTADGALPAPYYVRLDTATASTVNDTLVKRSSAGYFDVKDPTNAAHAASKGYVDGRFSTFYRMNTPDGSGYLNVTDNYLGFYFGGAWRFAVNETGIYIGQIPWGSVTGKPSTFTPEAHTHSAADLTSGTVPYARVQGSTGPHNYAVAGSGTYYSVWVDGAGRFGRSTSSRRYKARIEEWGEARDVLGLQPVTYVRRGEDGAEPGPGAAREFGLIAEDVAQLVPEIVVHDEAGRVDGVRYELLPVALLPVLRDLSARVAALEGVDNA